MRRIPALFAAVSFLVSFLALAGQPGSGPGPDDPAQAELRRVAVRPFPGRLPVPHERHRVGWRVRERHGPGQFRATPGTAGPLHPPLLHLLAGHCASVGDAGSVLGRGDPGGTPGPRSVRGALRERAGDSRELPRPREPGGQRHPYPAPGRPDRYRVRSDHRGDRPGGLDRRPRLRRPATPAHGPEPWGRPDRPSHGHGGVSSGSRPVRSTSPTAHSTSGRLARPAGDSAWPTTSACSCASPRASRFRSRPSRTQAHGSARTGTSHSVAGVSRTRPVPPRSSTSRCTSRRSGPT